MRKLAFFILLFPLNILICDAQNIPVRTLPTEIFRSVKKDMSDTIQWSWKRGGLFNMNLSQGSLSNWAAGGDNFSLAIASYVNYYVLHKRGRHTWDSNLDFNFGFMQTTNGGSRKNDDRLDFLSKYGYRVDSANKFFISGLFNFRTQLFDGLTYYKKDSGVISSTFLSPGYLVLSLGVDYKPTRDFSIFLSPLTNRLVIVASKKLYPKGVYGVPAGQQSINEVGAFASLTFAKNIAKNINYRGRLDLFTNYKHNPQNVDMFMTNFVSLKINKFISATYSLDLIYDDDVKQFGKERTSPGLQLKSLIGIGFMMPFTQVAQ